jgi:amino-acid N-acetyltransferase
MTGRLTGVSAEPVTAPGADAVRIRKAAASDIAELLRLINSYAGQGLMLPRTEFELAENLRDFSVVCEGERILGCCALHLYTPAMAEIRSLAIGPEVHGRGLGRALVAALEQEAAGLGLEAVFAFTYVPEFFRKLGYREVDRGELPLKAWKDCLRCPKFQCCDETAVMKRLGPGGSAAAGARPQAP